MKKILPYFLFVIIFLIQACDQVEIIPISFPYGVASGDPLPESVIIWTKIETEEETALIKGSWKVAKDEAMQEVVQKGEFTTQNDQDFTVKIDVQGLEAGAVYYYQFESNEQKSQVGRTKTTPQGKVDQIRFAVVSCSNYQAGYFNAYGNISRQKDLDAVIHLGDYIYEYQDGKYGDSTLMASGARAVEPKTELLKLDDYRARYATYRKDPDLQKLHQQYPFIVVWDDHETANDAHKDGAENHQDNEGDWERRRAAARQAYFEWLPIRDDADQIYRKFQFGDLAELIMLDTRLEGRDSQILDVKSPKLYEPTRSILGEKQKEWFLTSLKNSPAQWKIIGNQVMFAEYNVGWAAASSDEYTPEQLESIFLDIWDGYPAERAEIIQYLENEKINDVVFVTGDIHCSFAYDITLRPSLLGAAGQDLTYDPTTGNGSVAVEFVTPGITSANYDEIVGLEQAKQFQYQVNKPLPKPHEINPNPHMKYADLIRHGYLILDIRPDKTQADWYFSKDILQKTSEEVKGEGWFTKTGENRLEKVRE